MKKRIEIEGMTCAHCVHHVEVALEEIPALLNVEVNLGGNYAIVDSEDDVSDEEIKNAISEAGYTVTGITSI